MALRGARRHCVSEPLTTLCAAIVASATGALLKRLGVGRRYRYEIGDPDPELRPAPDTWPRHAAIVCSPSRHTGKALCHDVPPRVTTP